MTLARTLMAAAASAMLMAGAAQAAVTGTCDTGVGTGQGFGNKKYIEFSSVAANDAANVYCSTVEPSYSTSGGTPGFTFFADGIVYELADKSDENKGNGKVTLTIGSGTWSITDPTGHDVVVAFKHGDTYAGFKALGTSGAFRTGNNGPTGTDYSHAAVWVAMAAVPAPAALSLLALGLGGLGVAARRQRRRA